MALSRSCASLRPPDLCACRWATPSMKTSVTLSLGAMRKLASVVEPRIGFHSKALGVVMAEVPPGKRSGAHRHLYDEIDLIVGGKGKGIVEDKEYNFDTLDVLSIPVFQWHQYFNTGTERLRIVAINTRLALENLGLSLSHRGQLAEY